MDVENIPGTGIPLHLANRLEEWKPFDIAHRSANFSEDYIGIRGLAQTDDAFLDFIGDVGDDLNGTAEVVASTFFLDDCAVDRAGGDGCFPRQLDVDKALVVSKVEIRFRTIIGDKTLTVLVRVHRSGIDINVRIELEHRDFKATISQEASQRCGGDSLTD